MSAEENQFLGQYIPLHYHYQLLLDQARMQGFKEALQRLVPNQGLVADLGGGTGALSFFASKNASHVWCVERNPLLAKAAQKFLALNQCADKVTVVEADARDFVPPRPVDTVVCEMLHSGLLREKQIEVIDSFKRNYLQKFGAGLQLPRFIPEATFLAVQPVMQKFDFSGYRAPLPIFSDPASASSGTDQLGEPVLYSSIEYRQALPLEFDCRLRLSISKEACCNALRFITKNVLAILVEEKTTIDWHNFYLIVPLKNPVVLKAGENLTVSFNYKAGGSLEELLESLETSKE